MNADPFQIGAVLADQKRFIVPIYQRTYTWTKGRQLERVFDTVEAKARERLVKAPSNFPHYMGALLLSPRGKFAFGALPVFDVVDGQQRLTTYQLLLSALRDLARHHNAAALFEQLTTFLLNTNTQLMREPKVERFKLQPTSYDLSLFRNLIELDQDGLRKEYPDAFYKKGTVRPDARLPLLAWWYFREEASAFIKEDGPENISTRLSALSAAILEDFRVIVITLDPSDDAQVIFETLNSGGEPLAAMDLVRNDIFHRAIRGNEDPDELLERGWRVFDDPFWKQETVQGRIKKPRIDFFLAHSLAAETGNETLLSELYANYKRFAAEQGFGSVEAELEALVKHAPTYRALVAPAENGPLSALARQLAIFDVSTAYPLVFIISASDATDEEKSLLFQLIESYVVRRALCGLTSKAYNNTFLRVATQLRSAGVSVTSFMTAFAESDGDTVRFPSNEELHNALVTRRQYGAIPTPRLRYILGRLEWASRDAFDETIGLRDDLTIEHILPESWATHWPLSGGDLAPKDFLVAADDPRRTEIVRREQLKHTIGNLTLLTPAGNPRLGNLAFSVLDGALGVSKREAFRGSLLKMNQEIAANGSWGESQIEARSEALAERAVRIWPFPGLQARSQ